MENVHLRAVAPGLGGGLPWFVLDKMWVNPNENALWALLIISGVLVLYGMWPLAVSFLQLVRDAATAMPRLRFMVKPVASDANLPLPLDRGAATPTPREGAFPLSGVDSDGVRWEKVATYSDRSPMLRPKCLQPGGSPLLFKPNNGDDVRELREGDRIEEPSRGHIPESSGKLFCYGAVDGHQHEFLFTDSATYSGALARAEVRFRTTWGD